MTPLKTVREISADRPRKPISTDPLEPKGMGLPAIGPRGVRDYVNSNSGVRVLRVGGNWSNTTNAGVAYANANNDSTNSNTNIGGRLAYYFDADPAATSPTTVTIEPSTVGYGTVSPASVSTMTGKTITINADNSLTIDGTTVTANPTNSDAQYSYAFSGWSVSNGDKVTKNMTITANFTQTLNDYTVSIAPNESDYGSVSQSSVTVPYGTSISSNGNILTIGDANITATPATNDSHHTYTFSGWTNASGTVTGDRTVTANFTMTVDTVTVTFHGGAPSSLFTIATLEIPWGTTPMVFTPNLGDGIFDKWYTDVNLTTPFVSSTKLTNNLSLYCGATEYLKFTSSPVANGQFSANQSLGMMIFDATASESAYRVIWDFGDGTSSTDKVAYHMYSEPGKYNVTLSAYNYYGDVDVKEYQIIVADDDAIVVDSNVMYIGIALAIAALVSIFVVTRVL